MHPNYCEWYRFHHFINFPVSRIKGDILLLWHSGVDVKPVHINMNVISILIYYDPPNHHWLAAYVYGPIQWHQKARFWNLLDSTFKSFSGPWVCIGDFNNLLNQLENFGGWPVTSSSIGGLKDLMGTYDLIDIGFIGSTFTWTNNRHMLWSEED